MAQSVSSSQWSVSLLLLVLVARSSLCCWRLLLARRQHYRALSLQSHKRIQQVETIPVDLNPLHSVALLYFSMQKCFLQKKLLQQAELSRTRVSSTKVSLINSTETLQNCVLSMLKPTTITVQSTSEMTPPRQRAQFAVAPLRDFCPSSTSKVPSSLHSRKRSKAHCRVQAWPRFPTYLMIVQVAHFSKVRK